MKTVLVTGASRSIGLTITRELGINGYHVIVMVTRDEAPYPESIKTLLEAGISYTWYAGDIEKSENRSRTVWEAAEKSGGIHVLVDNAGVAPKIRVDLLEIAEKSFDYVIGTNIKGNMSMIQATARQMMKQPAYEGKRGATINISSCSSRVSPVNRGEYCVSKAGIFMLTRLFADGLVPEGIFVYEMRSGVIHTDMISRVEGGYMELIRQGILPITR